MNSRALQAIHKTMEAIPSLLDRLISKIYLDCMVEVEQCEQMIVYPLQKHLKQLQTQLVQSQMFQTQFTPTTEQPIGSLSSPASSCKDISEIGSQVNAG